MSSPKETAEDRYRKAFERLKNNTPIVVEAGTPVSQNNVSIEAGRDPTALKLTRFPALVKDIKAYVEARDVSDVRASRTRREAKKAREDCEQKAARMELERDLAQSKLNALQNRLLEALGKVDTLEKDLAKYEPPPSPLRG